MLPKKVTILSCTVTTPANKMHHWALALCARAQRITGKITDMAVIDPMRTIALFIKRQETKLQEAIEDETVGKCGGYDIASSGRFSCCSFILYSDVGLGIGYKLAMLTGPFTMPKTLPEFKAKVLERHYVIEKFQNWAASTHKPT